jgi:hypothetical protein
MRRSGKVSIIIALVLSSVGVTGFHASAKPSAHLRDNYERASSYRYNVATRSRLLVRQPRFDVSDGLQRWERLLLAMDPDGGGGPGR